MPPTDSPTWWADVQQEREDLGGRRPADDWLGEEIDFAPRRRITRGRTHAADLVAIDGADHALHGVFVAAAPHAPMRTVADAPAPATSRIIELGRSVDAAADDLELAHLAAADDPFATPPPPAGARRTVQIKGRPHDARLPSMALRHRSRSPSERLGPRPDRIALWAVVLGVLLIVLAATTS